MTEALTILKADLRDTLATVGGLRAEERLELNDQLTELLSSLKVLKGSRSTRKGPVRCLQTSTQLISKGRGSL